MNTIKEIKLAMLFLAIVACGACSDDDGSSGKKEAYECQTCSDEPIAKVAFDSNSGGIYKGVIIGSSGTVVFDINNSGDQVTAIMTLDGDTIILNSTVSWTNGQPYLAPFTGTYNGQNLSVTFSVGALGENPFIVEANIPGHPNATFVIIKEVSTMLVECFEGTYHSTEPVDGTFNILLSRDIGKWGGIARENGSSMDDDISGSIDSNNKLIEDEGGLVVGTLQGDEINGSFLDDDGNTNTIQGQRTM